MLNTKDQKNLLEIKDAVLAWFFENHKNYSFRNNRTPYRVWISEVLLQQTRMGAALQKIEKFLDTFPDLQSLAEASEEQVLTSFKGLGYYNRARNLHKGAKLLMTHYDSFPARYTELIHIPSIGEYTAAAIASICFGEHIPVIDGNIKRIYARLFEINYRINKKDFIIHLKQMLDYIFALKKNNPGDINEAFMQFGQIVCKPKNPECSKCVIKDKCKAYFHRTTKLYPVTEKSILKKDVKWKIYFLVHEKSVLINKYQDFFLLNTHNGFPSVIEMEDEVIFSATGDVFKNYLRHHRTQKFFAGPRHTITHYKIKFEFCVTHLKEKDQLGDNVYWHPVNVTDNLLISSGLLKTWRQALDTHIARGGT